MTLCDAQNPWGASWAPDDTIVFGQGPDGIFRVSADGSAPEVLIPVDAAIGESAQGPQLLPGGKAALFTLGVGGDWDEAQVVVQSLDTGERSVLVEGGSDVRYVPTGHLVYALAGTLLAVPFDLVRLEVTGGPVPILEGVMRSTVNTGAAHFSVSDTGSLVFVAGISVAQSTFVWVDRQGGAEALPAPPRPYSRPRLSPDGQRVAVDIEGDIWVYDIPRGTLTRLTFDGSNSTPAWTPDGKRLAFSSTRAGPASLFWKLADGSGEAERLTTSEGQGHHIESFSPDGKVLAFHAHHTGQDIWVLPLEGERKPRPFLQTPAEEWGSEFSPDGRWLAYMSNESGRNEIYVQPFPGPAGKFQISTEGGSFPVWARNGELFYRNGDKMMAVDITTSPSFTAGNARLLFEGQYQSYDVTADAERFLMIREGEQGATRLNVVLNWFEELKRLVPTD